MPPCMALAMTMSVSMARGQIVLPAQPATISAGSPEMRLRLAREQMQEHAQAGRWQEALAACDEAWAVIEKYDSAESLNAAGFSVQRAMILRAAGQWQEARKWAQKAVEIREQRMDRKSLDYALTLQCFGEICLDARDAEAAFKAFTVMLPLLKEKLPPEHPVVATGLHDLGTAEVTTFRKEGEMHLQEALAMREKLHGPESLEAALTTIMLGQFYRSQERFNLAELQTQKAVKIYRDRMPNTGLMLMRSLQALVELHRKMGAFSAAMAEVDELIELIQRIASGHPELMATAKRERANIFYLKGEAVNAESEYEAAAGVARHASVPPGVLDGILLDQATFYSSLGAIAKARDLYSQVYQSEVQREGRDSANAFTAGCAFAHFLWLTAHDNNEARRMYKAIAESCERAGRYCPTEVWFQWASLEKGGGNSALSKQLMERLVADAEKSGNTHLRQYELTKAWLAGGNDLIKRAEAFEGGLERALTQGAARRAENGTTPGDINNMTVLASQKLALGKPEQAAEWAQRALDAAKVRRDQTTDDAVAALSSLIFAHHDLRHDDKLPKLMSDWAECLQQRHETMLGMSDRNARTQWLLGEFPFDLPASLGLVNETATTLLRFKNIGFDVERVERQMDLAGRTPEGRGFVARYSDASRKWNAALAGKASKEVIERLRAELSRMEQSTGDRRTSLLGGVLKSLSLTPADVDARLADDAAVLDLFGYSHRERGGSWANRYGIMVLRKGRSPELVTVSHTPEEVDAAALTVLGIMNDAPNEKRFQDAPLSKALHALHDMLVAPASGHLKGIKTLYVCPDQRLQFVPFGMLLDGDDEFLTMRLNIRYLTSMRDLFAPQAEVAQASRSIVAFGGVDYAAALPKTKMRPVTPLEQRFIDPLLSADEKEGVSELLWWGPEARAIKECAMKAGWQSMIVEGAEATEAALCAQRSPGVLHLSTHGYSLPSAVVARGDALKAEFDATSSNRFPNHHGARDAGTDGSGLLLAGVDATMAAWRKGLTAEFSNDGVFTASEAFDLDLRGTRLVVLSACQTGLGNPGACSGPAGWRTALLHAGAQNVISTLWPIGDLQSVVFMRDFYGRFMVTENAAAALDETQRYWLPKARKKAGVHLALLIAGGFVLSSAGAP